MILLLNLCCLTAFSQIESVIVETYYISNADDATDTLGGDFEEGYTTYRIFIDLLPETKIVSIYGNERHPLVFSSTEPFFNHQEEGITFGKDLSRNRYEIGTVPLDTYITLGQCSKSFSQGAYFGIPKHDDQDGSIVGGENNDGGSQEIPSGLLNNTNSQVGIPLTTADGLTLSQTLPDSWIEVGFKDLVMNTDTTIFGSNGLKETFTSINALLKNSGVIGIDPVQNEILVAQLTTLGDISFEINLELEILVEGVPQLVKYVARNEALAEHEVFQPLLSYPYECGCTDPDYLEASTLFACTDNSKCLTQIVIGCMDSLACNYNREANFNLPELCCYVGFCHDLDISVVCPDLQPREGIDRNQIKLYPNPVNSELIIALEFVLHNDIAFIIYDMLGRSVHQGVMQGQTKHIEVSHLVQGYFTLQMNINGELFSLPFVKE